MININVEDIKPYMPVVCSEDGQFGVVDHLEGTDSIKLTRDQQGQHHYIPTGWVTRVDDKVHVDRPGRQAMAEWSLTLSSSAPDAVTPVPERKAARG